MNKSRTTCCLLAPQVTFTVVMCGLQCAFNRKLEVTDHMHREQDEQMVKMAPEACFCVSAPWWFNQAQSRIQPRRP